MKMSIKILTIVSMAILIIACIVLTVLLFVTTDLLNEAEHELWETQKQMEEYKKELDAYNPTTTDTFANTEELMNAIKHNPSHYNGKVVVVEGIVKKTNDEISLANFNDRYSSGSIGRLTSPYIRICILDTLQQSVVDYGDHIKLKGTVTISNGEIYLDNCTYTMIATSAER